MKFSSRVFVAVVAIFCAGTACAAPDVVCERTYQKLYSDPSKFKISVVFGYTNDPDTDEVGDPTSDLAVQYRLLASCWDVPEPCGFSRIENGRFSKVIFGPDGKERVVEIDVSHSAYSDKNSENVGIHSAEQKLYSQTAEQNFFKSLSDSDIVIYDGHARHGTGPGFAPLSLGGWAWAISTKSRLIKMMETLLFTWHPPKVIAMLSCDSEMYYGAALHFASPRSALILHRQYMTGGDNMRTLDAVIGSFLTMKCEKEFHQALTDALTTYIVHPDELAPLKEEYRAPVIYGFFEGHPHYEAPAWLGRGPLADHFETMVSKTAVAPSADDGTNTR